MNVIRQEEMKASVFGVYGAEGIYRAASSNQKVYSKKADDCTFTASLATDLGDQPCGNEAPASLSWGTGSTRQGFPTSRIVPSVSVLGGGCVPADAALTGEASAGDSGRRWWWAPKMVCLICSRMQACQPARLCVVFSGARVEWSMAAITCSGKSSSWGT